MAGSQSSMPKIFISRLAFPRFLNPSIMDIFFHGFSVRFLGLWLRNGNGSVDGGVVGGVMSSPMLALDPESSVRERSLPPGLGVWPLRWPDLPRLVIMLRLKLDLLEWLLATKGDPSSLADDGGVRRFDFDRDRFSVGWCCSSKLDLPTTITPSSLGGENSDEYEGML